MPSWKDFHLQLQDPLQLGEPEVSQKIFADYKLSEAPEPSRCRACKEPLEYLGLQKFSAFESEHNFGSHLIRVGVCQQERVLMLHRRVLYATRTQGVRYKLEWTNSYQPLTPQTLATCVPVQPIDDQHLWQFTRYSDMGYRWMIEREGELGPFKTAESAHKWVQSNEQEYRIYNLRLDFFQQGPGISRQDFLMRMQPGPVFGFIE